MELKNRTLSNFAELVRTGECKKFRGRLKVGVDLGTAQWPSEKLWDLCIIFINGGFPELRKKINAANFL